MIHTHELVNSSGRVLRLSVTVPDGSTPAQQTAALADLQAGIAALGTIGYGIPTGDDDDDEG